MLNIQAPEKSIHDPEGHLDVHSIFKTIQGEGPFAGRPSIFVRLAGCNLQCPLCDTEYTSRRERMSPSYLLDRIIELEGRTDWLVVLTGGEPLRQNIYPFVRECLRAYEIQIETNGTFPIAWELTLLQRKRLHIVCSPKAPAINLALIEYLDPRLDCLKYVIQEGHVSEEDGLPLTTLGMSTSVARLEDIPIYVQPLDEDNAERNYLNTQAAIKSCLQFGYRFCPQIHKQVGLP